MEPFEISDFEKQINNIYDLAFKYGLKSVKGPVDIRNPKFQLEFFSAVHKGFALAQDEIINLLLSIDRDRGLYKQELKDARKRKDTREVKSIKNKQMSLDNQENIVRKIADAIAWQMFGDHSVQGHYIARRMYLGEPQLPIKNSNLRHGKEFVDKYNAENPYGFALLSDLTSFIQIGDVLVLDHNDDNGKVLKLLELKEGKVNDEVRHALDFFYQSKCERALYYFAEEKGERHFKQLQRMAKQDLKGTQAISILNKGHGIDLATEAQVIIPEDVFVLNHYEGVVFELLKKCEEKGWAIDYIQGGLFIGVYTDKFPSERAFSAWLKLNDINYPIVNFRQAFSIPLSFPPFLIPFSEVETKNLMMERKRIFLCLNFKEWFKMASDLGMEGKWLSNKETDKLLKRKCKPFTFDNKAIQFKVGEKHLIMGDGILARIFFEFVEPLSALQYLQQSLDVEVKELEIPRV